MDMEEDERPKSDKVTKIRNFADLQRLKLEKLMKNPEKPVIIPERVKSKSVPTVPDFVRNVMGSSAGAGSGEFHVYRHLRRKEYARQKFIKEMSERERLQMEYQDKLENNRKEAEEKTAKKRAKRLKKKARAKENKKRKPEEKVEEKSESEEDSEEEKDDSAEESKEQGLEGEIYDKDNKVKDDDVDESNDATKTAGVDLVTDNDNNTKIDDKDTETITDSQITEVSCGTISLDNTEICKDS